MSQPSNTEKTLLRKAGKAIHDYGMIHRGDRIAVGVSGGKDSMVLLEILCLLQKKSPVPFHLQAFTVEQGKFLQSIDPLAKYMKKNGIKWTYYRDEPSLQLLKKEPKYLQNTYKIQIKDAWYWF